MNAANTLFLLSDCYVWLLLRHIGVYTVPSVTRVTGGIITPPHSMRVYNSAYSSVI